MDICFVFSLFLKECEENLLAAIGFLKDSCVWNLLLQYML